MCPESPYPTDSFQRARGSIGTRKTGRPQYYPKIPRDHNRYNPTRVTTAGRKPGQAEGPYHTMEVVFQMRTRVPPGGVTTFLHSNPSGKGISSANHYLTECDKESTSPCPTEQHLPFRLRMAANFC